MVAWRRCNRRLTDCAPEPNRGSTTAGIGITNKWGEGKLRQRVVRQAPSVLCWCDEGPFRAVYLRDQRYRSNTDRTARGAEQVPTLPPGAAQLRLGFVGPPSSLPPQLCARSDCF